MEFLQSANPVIYVVAVVIGTMFFVPGSISMMVGGFLYGFSWGFVWAAIGIAVGAQAAFESGRWVARPWVSKKLDASPRMRAIAAALNNEAFLIVFLSRLSLPIPYNLLNYLYGATPVRASTYGIATALGMLPAVALYVYLGTVARDLEQIVSGEATPSELGYWILAAGTVAIIAVMWVIHRTAAKALNKHIDEEVESTT